MSYPLDPPYFIHPAVTALREGTAKGEEAVRLRRIVAANVGDETALRIMLGIDPEEFASFYPDMIPPALSTDDTIDSFLNRFGQTAPLPQAAAEIPVPTEEEAMRLVKSHDYEGALEIISRLNLNYPEKSIYFADQIRFLKKLILNEASKQQTTGV